MTINFKEDKDVIIISIIGIFAIFLIANILYFAGHNEGYKQGYDKGYTWGWYNSQFIDCSLPEINQTMRIITAPYGKSKFLTWKEVCERLHSYYQFNNSNLEDISEGDNNLTPLNIFEYKNFYYGEIPKKNGYYKYHKNFSFACKVEDLGQECFEEDLNLEDISDGWSYYWKTESSYNITTNTTINRSNKTNTIVVKTLHYENNQCFIPCNISDCVDFCLECTSQGYMAAFDSQNLYCYESSNFSILVGMINRFNGTYEKMEYFIIK